MLCFIFTDCDCNPEGSNGVECDIRHGKCVCKSNIFGDKCDRCFDGFYGFPDCQRRFQLLFFCNLLEIFQGQRKLSQLTGDKKKISAPWFLDTKFFPPFKSNSFGESYQAPAYLSIFFSKHYYLNKNIKKIFVLALEIYKSKFSACSCNVKGSIGTNCDRNGKCNCKSSAFAGVKCEKKNFKEGMFLKMFLRFI